MRTRDIERYRRLLLKMKEALQRGWEFFEKENLAQNIRDQLGQVSYYTTHPADMSSIADEQERAFLLATHEKTIMDEIDNALRRIENGVFGKCTRCGKNIEKDRLSAVPYTEFCLECQEVMESEEFLERV